MSLYWLIPLCIASYFIGNVNLSIYVSRRVHKKNIQKLGSGNPGTMNMVRNFGVKWGLLVGFFDVVKGVIPALAGYLLYLPDPYTNIIAAYSCGIAAIVGHAFPVLYKFKGGKGVATTIGVFLVAHPVVALIAFSFWVVYLLIFEYSSMASFIFITTVVVWQQLYNDPNLVISILSCTIYFFSWYTHRENIFRLLVGKENTATLLKQVKQKRRKEKEKKWLEQLNQ